MANIPFSDLVFFNPRISYNNVGYPFPKPLSATRKENTLSSPLSTNAYLLFRAHKQPDQPKPMVLVTRTDDADATRLADRFVTWLPINAQGTITTTTENSDVIEGYYFYPVNIAGETELYDVYIVPKSLLNNFQESQLDSYIPMTGVNNYLYPLLGMPDELYLSQDINGDTRVSNLVKDGQFATTEINLPPVVLGVAGAETKFEEGDIRDPITQINDNATYEVSCNNNYNLSLFGDNLSVETFVGDPEIESAPEKYLRILASNENPAQPWVYRDLAFYFQPYYKFNDRPFIISFWAINNNLDLTTNLPVTLGYERFYGDESAAEPRSTFTDIEPFAITNLWTKYFASIDLSTNSNYEQTSDNTYVKLLIRLPVNLNSFDISITNILIDYGSSNVTYPVDYEQTYENTVTNYGKPIVNTSSGYIPLSSRAGEIKQFIHSNDTETTILANGRVIYPDDEHFYQMVDPASGKSAVFRIPYSNAYGTGLYDLIGYQYGTGDDHFTCDSLHNPAWENDAVSSGFDSVFYWNYSRFHPTSDFVTGFGDLSVIEAIELHRGQNIDASLVFNSFFKTDANNEIWYSSNPENYITAGVANGLNPQNFGNYELSVNYATHTGTVPSRTFKARDQINNSYASYEIKFPIEDYGVNVGFPLVKLNRGFESGNNFGFIDCEKVGISEFYEYEVVPYYYENRTNLNAVPANIDALTLMNAKVKNSLYAVSASSGDGSDLPPNNRPIVRIKDNSGAFPISNPNFTVTPVALVPGQNTANQYVIDTVYINTYFTDAQYNWQTLVGDNTSIKKMKISLAIQGQSGFGIKLKSSTAAAYYGKWFTAESRAERIIKQITYTNNIPSTNNITIQDNKFCFYFSNGSTPQPTDVSIPSGTTFIPIVIPSTADKPQISQALEKAVNSYRVQIPNFQGLVLKGQGYSIFDKPLNSTNPINQPSFCKNFRNQGFGYPKMEKERNFDVITSNNFGGSGVSISTHVFNSYSVSSVINPENYAYIYNHISVC